jgi:hypothetical protein
MSWAARHPHRRQQRLRNAAGVQGAEFRRMRSGGPAREASAAEPACGGGKCEAGAHQQSLHQSTSKGQPLRSGHAFNGNGSKRKWQQKEHDAPELIDTGGLLARKRSRECHWMLAAPQTATAGLRGGRRPCGAQRRAGARSAQKRHDGASKSAPGPRSCSWTTLRPSLTREAKPARANRPRLRRSYRFVPAKPRLGRFERRFGEGDRGREHEPRRQRYAGSQRVVFGSTVMDGEAAGGRSFHFSRSLSTRIHVCKFRHNVFCFFLTVEEGDSDRWA